MQQRILIAEHEADLLESLTCGLRASGYEAIPAVSGLETLKKARALLPELIVLDSLLPDIDGPAVCDILRRLPSTATIPIILLTNWSEPLVRSRPADAGPDACLTKPFSPAELEVLIDETLSRWHEIRLDREAVDQLTNPEPRIDWSEV